MMDYGWENKENGGISSLLHQTQGPLGQSYNQLPMPLNLNSLLPQMQIPANWAEKPCPEIAARTPLMSQWEQ